MFLSPILFCVLVLISLFHAHDITFIQVAFTSISTSSMFVIVILCSPHPWLWPPPFKSLLLLQNSLSCFLCLFIFFLDVGKRVIASFFEMLQIWPKIVSLVTFHYDITFMSCLLQETCLCHILPFLHDKSQSYHNMWAGFDNMVVYKWLLMSFGLTSISYQTFRLRNDLFRTFLHDLIIVNINDLPQF